MSKAFKGDGMQSSVGIRERIDHVYSSLRPAERAVAQFVRDHLDEAAEMTVGQLAQSWPGLWTRPNCAKPSP